MTVYDYSMRVFRTVKRGCLRCGVSDDSLRRCEFVLSPGGVAHYTRSAWDVWADNSGNTACGKDATRDGWWWPE